MDLILFNGKIATIDSANSYVEAVAIKDGLIIKTGRDEDILSFRQDGTEIINLQGKLVLPGFNDSHVHLLNYAYSLKKVDCSHAKSIEEIIYLGKKYIKENNIKPGEWILGRGWNQIMFQEKREINRYDLDKISTENPISFTRICEHITVANSKALQVCEINKTSSQVVGGHFDIDTDGEPTGIFREAARYMIYEKIPNATKDEIKDMLKNAANVAASYGITSVHTDDFETFSDKNYEKIIQAYKELIHENELSIRVYAQCLLPNIDDLKNFIHSGYKTGLGDKYFKIGPLKLLTDGSLGARTALLHEPYTDDSTTRGISVFTQDELDDLVVTAHCNGMQILTHAIGDRAMDMCMNSFEKAMGACKIDDPRFGIVHLQIMNENIINRFSELDIIAYAEPVCVNNDLHMAEERVGPERIKTSYCYKTLLNKGIKMCLSSDCPVDSLNPMDTVYAAVNRKDYSGFPQDGWYPEERLSVKESVYSFTMGSAYASYEENVKGSIEEGKYADLVVLSKDIFNVDTNIIQDTEVVLTIMDGKIVYRRNTIKPW